MITNTQSQLSAIQIMAQRLNFDSVDFHEAFNLLLRSKREADIDVHKVVEDIITCVRRDGDAALLDCTAKYDSYVADSVSLWQSQLHPVRSIDNLTMKSDMRCNWLQSVSRRSMKSSAQKASFY